MPPTVYLTFDDGPYPATKEVLDVLGSLQVKATFFLCAIHMKGDPGQQYRLVRRMLTEGHSIGNHGYDHDPASKKGYQAATVADVQQDFTGNVDRFVELFKKNGDKFPGFPVARLPGDGRLMRDFVSMITNDVKVPHAGWDFEFADNRRMNHITFSDWQGVTGVGGTAAGLPAENAILLLHDKHWTGKGPLLKSLLAKLMETRTITSLDPIPRTHPQIRYP